MFKNHTTSNDGHYHNPPVPTKTWNWQSAKKSGQSTEASVVQQIKASTDRIATELSTETVPPPSSSTTSTFNQEGFGIPPTVSYVTILDKLYEPGTTSQLCFDTWRTTRFATLCQSIGSTYSSTSLPVSSSTNSISPVDSTGIGTRSAANPSAMSSMKAQDSGSKKPYSVDALSSTWQDHTLHLTSSSWRDIKTSSPTTEIQSMVQQQSQISNKFTSTATYQYTSHGGTSTNSPASSVVNSAHMTRTDVVATIALGAVGVVLLFFLFIYIIRCYCTKRRPPSSAEREFRITQEQSSHPLTVNARCMPVAAMTPIQWHSWPTSSLAQKAVLVKVDSTQPNPRHKSTAEMSNTENMLKVCLSKELSHIPLEVHVTRTIPYHGNVAKHNAATDLLMPPAIPSPWSWVSSRTSTTSVSGISFDSCGQRRCSDPFDLEGKGFDFNC